MNIKVSVILSIVVLFVSGGAAYGKLWADVQQSKRADERIESKVDKILDFLMERG